MPGSTFTRVGSLVQLDNKVTYKEFFFNNARFVCDGKVSQRHLACINLWQGHLASRVKTCRLLSEEGETVRPIPREKACLMGIRSRHGLRRSDTQSKGSGRDSPSA